MEQESVIYDINSQQIFEALPLKPNSQRKTWVRMTEFHPIQQSPSMNCPVEFPDSGTRHSSQIDGDRQPADLYLGASWNYDRYHYSSK
jgi:hypothetical protein